MANLSSQLIVKFGLTYLTEDGLLPGWAQTPMGFEFILGQAAGRAHRSGSRLIMVVDGLDEAEPVKGGLPFGLPKQLPDGVYVVGTYRTGWSPGQPDTQSVVTRIRKDDPRNAADIREFLAAAAAEKVLASHLNWAGVASEDFIRLLSSRCDGIWVYLRYVLYELRTGLRHIDAIADLPVGLHRYYADQIRRWQAESSWASCLLPLLATLGVAAEPLPIGVLARLAGDLDIQQVRRICNQVFRPVLMAGRPRRGAPLRYEVYHASFRQLLQADYGTAAIPGELPSELEALADELGEATIAAHSRVTDIYLGEFGGLEAGLPELAARPTMAGVDDGYPLRHLAGHLRRANRVADLHKFLAVTCQLSSDQAVNVWFAAHDAAGRLTSYLDDLIVARDICVEATDEAVASRQSAQTVGIEVRYTLMAASIASRAARITPELIDLLISTGTWSAERGLDHSRHLADPLPRAQALMTVYSHMAASARQAVAAEVMDATRAIKAEYDRAAALTRLAELLPAERRAPAVAAALAAAVTSDEYFQGMLLDRLAPYLTAAQLDRALDAAVAISEPFRGPALVALAPRLTADQADRALDAAFGIWGPWLPETLPGLAPYLNNRQLHRAIQFADGIDYPWHRALILSSLAACLPVDEQPPVLSRAFEVAMSDSFTSAQALMAMIDYFPAEQQPSVVAAALTRVSASYDHLDVLARLAPHLSENEKSKALSDFFHDSDSRARNLAHLAPHLSAEQLSRALDMVAEDHHDDRGKMLVSLARYVTGEQIPRALELAATVRDEVDRAEALDRLASHLTADQITRALEIAAGINDDTERVWTLTRLAAKALSEKQRAAVARAFDAATAIDDDKYRVLALASLASRLPGGERRAVLARVLEAANGIGNHQDRAEALTSLAAKLPGQERTAALLRALDAVAAIGSDWSRTLALTSLITQLPADESVVLARALDVAATIDSSHQADALGALAPRLDESLLPRALDAAMAIRDDRHRSHALASLAPYLDRVALPRAVDAAKAITEKFYRDHALTALMRHRPGHRRQSLAQRMLRDAIAVDSVLGGIEALADLPRHLTKGLVSSALDAAFTHDEANRAETLAELAPYLDEEQLSNALAAILTLDEEYQAEALAKLARYLDEQQLSNALDAVLTLDEKYRAEGFLSLAPHLNAEQKDRLLGMIDAQGDDRDRTRTLVGIAPFLTPEQMPLALDYALGIRNSQERPRALADLASYLSGDQLFRALNSAADSIEAVTALLARNESLRETTGEYLPWPVLRSTLTSGSSRAFCLSVIEHVTSIIFEVGGIQAVKDCIDEIDRTHAWWH